MTVPRRMHGVPMERQRTWAERERQPATPLEQRAIRSFRLVTFQVASPQKRFALSLSEDAKLTEKQRKYLWRLAWTYRRQITDTEVTARAEAVREWANERHADAPAGDPDLVPVSATEPTVDDVASLPWLFDDMGAGR